MRVVTLLPAATEIVCALGAEGELVGVSHECDFPPAVRDRPRLTGSRLGTTDSAAIDAEVRELVSSALSIYPLDAELLARLAPDVIVTQDLCRVCAVPRNEVEAAARDAGLTPRALVALAPRSLADVFADVLRVGEALGRADRARALVAELRRRLDQLAARTQRLPRRPRVLTLEWLEPAMVGGTWMPELVAVAGGTALGARAGELAPTRTLDELGAFEPEVLVIKPCGFDLARTRGERALVARVVAACGGSARATGAVWLADGNAFFNRPGPRLVESAEILAACAFPGECADLAARHAGSFERWTGA